MTKDLIDDAGQHSVIADHQEEGVQFLLHMAQLVKQ